MSLTPADLKRLAGVHPDAIYKFSLTVDDMAGLGYTMMATDGVRTLAQQTADWLKGRNGNPGPRVTDADGIIVKSHHQIQIDGYGHAIDACFVLDDKPSWAKTLPWSLYGARAKAHGLKWGGDWAKPDEPHVELPGP